ncbi:MAG: cytochrome c biogenesis protein CcsA [Deltaproteobacteria bacterium]|nr:cytochrome c biogenesis protein CcsA [Deltaproteobacteria bacterium]MBW2067537.1 cytochrome c biogenesis protein CcsA [Deltaproteobacteria bacterium]
MESLSTLLAVVLYLFSAVAFCISECRRVKALHPTALLFAGGGLLSHTAALWFRCYETPVPALFNTRFALSFFGFLLVTLFLSVYLRHKRPILGAFVMPLATISVAGSLFIPSGPVSVNPALKNSLVIVHLMFLFVAYAFFALAFCISIMYVLQERMIKKKNIQGWITRMPSLETLDRINHSCILIGFPFMTVGLIIGFAAAKILWHRGWSGDPKEVFSILTWIIYAVLFHERLAVGWRGKKASWLAICGFASVVVTFLGVNLFMKGHHTTFTGR